MKPSLLQIGLNPKLMEQLTEEEFRQTWEDLVKLSKDLDTLQNLFLKDYSRRAKTKATVSTEQSVEKK